MSEEIVRELDRVVEEIDRIKVLAVLLVSIAGTLLVVVSFFLFAQLGRARANEECVGYGYTSFQFGGHCIRTVNGTDEVVPLEELRDE